MSSFKEITEFSLLVQPSFLGGVGVFSAHPISANVAVFTGQCHVRHMNPADIPEMFLKYCIFLNKDECICPERFDRMEISWYLNHSHTPNLVKREDRLVTLRLIETGEELLMDYNQLDEPEHLKEPYYIK